MADTILSFLKFGDENRINDMFENGTIFINTIEYFRKHKDKKGRGDPYEGASYIKNYPPGIFEIKSTNYKGNYLKLHIKESYESVLGNILSLYSVSSKWCNNPANFKIDKRMALFGSHCLVIKNNALFLSLIENKLEENGYKYWHNFVTYYNKEKVSGKINLFQKTNEYAYQREFRFYIENNTLNPIKFQIGHLGEIAEIVPTTDVLKLKLKPKITY